MDSAARTLMDKVVTGKREFYLLYISTEGTELLCAVMSHNIIMSLLCVVRNVSRKDRR